jgi:hypothetical protein
LDKKKRNYLKDPKINVIDPHQWVISYYFLSMLDLEPNLVHDKLVGGFVLMIFSVEMC